MDIQITLIDKSGTYKPLSTVVHNIESMDYYETHKKTIQRTAIQQISNQRQLTWEELKRLGFTQCKARAYEPKKWALINRLKKEAKKRELINNE